MLTSAGIGTLITAAGLLGVGAALNYPELVQIGAVGVGAVVLSVGLAWRRPRVDVRVCLTDDRVVDGEAPRLLVTLTNNGRRRCFVTLLRVQVGDIPVNIELGSVRAGGRVDFAPRLPLLRRGIYPLSEARLGYRDPFDFARANHLVRVLETLYVYPRTEAVAPMPLGGPQDLDGRPLNPMAGGDAFYSLREYMPGDSWRSIHWPTTARQATLMVRHTTIPEETVHTVVLDTARQAYAHEQCFEQAVRIAGSICQAALRAGHTLSLLAGTESVVQAATEHRGDVGAYGRALDLLAGILWTDAGVDRRTLESVPTGGCLMVVTGRPTPALADWLSDLSRHMAASYLVQVLDSAQRPVDAPAGVQSFVVDSLDGFCAAWWRWSRS
jgi:uncharacterized protein (DUF58 family)